MSACRAALSAEASTSRATKKCGTVVQLAVAVVIQAIAAVELFVGCLHTLDGSTISASTILTFATTGASTSHQCNREEERTWK